MQDTTGWPHAVLAEIARKMTCSKHCRVMTNTKRRAGISLAGREAVYTLLDDLIAILFPGCHGREPMPFEEIAVHVEDTLRNAAVTLRQQSERAFRYQCEFEKCKHCHDCENKALDAVNYLLESLPRIQGVLHADMLAAYEGDPAARSLMEIVMSYPGFTAIVTHRIAHLLYERGVPLIPRIMSERAHSTTGIDIHPGARIGPGFFIDHGTGVVIGETCVIGRNVKLYQGVTLGAISFPKDKDGNPIKGIKRHPNVEDDVTIYAGATILGGQTTIGHGSEIGGNVWLTHSVPPNSKVYNQQPQPLIRNQSETPLGADGNPAG